MRCRTARTDLIEQLGHRFPAASSRCGRGGRPRACPAAGAGGRCPGGPDAAPSDYDRNGRVLQVADDLYAADRHEFAFEWAGDGTACNG